MKMWVDDERPSPDSWLCVKSAPVAIAILKANVEFNKFDTVSLDHDLGNDNLGTGYSVLCWIEDKAMTDLTYLPPFVIIHTANPSVRKKMTQAADKVNEIRADRMRHVK